LSRKKLISKIPKSSNHIGVGMVSSLVSSVVDHGTESQLGQTKDYKIGICCFPTI